MYQPVPAGGHPGKGQASNRAAPLWLRLCPPRAFFGALPSGGMLAGNTIRKLSSRRSPTGPTTRRPANSERNRHELPTAPPPGRRAAPTATQPSRPRALRYAPRPRAASIRRATAVRRWVSPKAQPQPKRPRRPPNVGDSAPSRTPGSATRATCRWGGLPSQGASGGATARRALGGSAP